MSKVPQKDLKLWRGNTERLVYRFKQSDGTYLDLNGSLIEFSISHKDGTLLLSSSNTSQINSDNFSNGEIEVFIDSSTTSMLTRGGNNMYYELERKINGEEKTLLWGKVFMEGPNINV